MLIVVLFAFSIWMIGNNASDFMSQSGRIHDQAERACSSGAQTSSDWRRRRTVDQLIHRLNPASYVGKIASVLRGVGEGSVFVLIYFGFLIASRQGFERKS